jgi:transposase
MIQITPQMRILLAVEPVDFRRGSDGLIARCRQALGSDPQTGALFVFRSRGGHAIKCLTYYGQGYWCCQKRLSQGRFGSWPMPGASAALRLEPQQLHLLRWNGDPSRAVAAPLWRAVPVAG